MTGLDRWIDHSGPDCIGKAATFKERGETPRGNGRLVRNRIA